MDWKRLAEEYRGELEAVQNDLWEVENILEDVCYALDEFEAKVRDRGKSLPKAMLQTFKEVKKCKVKVSEAGGKSDATTHEIEIFNR